jgi:hypothetical protein
MLRLGVAGPGLVWPPGTVREMTKCRQRGGFAAGGAGLPHGAQRLAQVAGRGLGFPACSCARPSRVTTTAWL